MYKTMRELHMRWPSYLDGRVTHEVVTLLVVVFIHGGKRRMQRINISETILLCDECASS